MIRAILLSNTPTVEQLFRYYASQQQQGFDVSGVSVTVVTIGCIALAVWIVVLVLRRRDRKGRLNSHPALFRELCRAHGLDRSSCGMLHQLARHQRLAQPSRLFLEPELFDAASGMSELRRRIGEVVALRDKLFANSAPAESARREERSVPARLDKVAGAIRPAEAVPRSGSTAAV